MFSTLRTRFGIPGVISVMALVFAMFGGAYAASNSSDNGKATASAKAKKGPRGPKGATGPAGPQGPAGPAGPAGAKGDAGGAGSNGVSVTSTESANAIEGHCTGTGTSGKGGSKFVSASGVTYACNGKEGEPGEPGEPGDPWTPGGTLPFGATETGTWVATINATEGGYGQISFPIPLANPLDETHVVMVAKGAEGEPGKCSNPAGTVKGTVANPLAAPGYLCVYESGTVAGTGGGGAFLFSVRDSSDWESLEQGAGRSGATITVLGNPSEAFQGTWAVTAGA